MFRIPREGIQVRYHMKLSQKIRRVWHDAFYYRASKLKVEFALKCNTVTEAIDLKTRPETLTDRFRMALHLSLCQACRNYQNVSRVLSFAVKSSPPPPIVKSVDELNANLLEKFGRKSSFEADGRE